MADDPLELLNFEDVPRIAAQIVHKNYTRIGIQCPDGPSLRQCTEFFHKIQAEIKLRKSIDNLIPTLFILADTTSNSSCCIDHVAAEHYAADCIIHLGRACLTKSMTSVPVIYSFPKFRVNIELFSQAIQKIPSTSLLFVCDLSLSHAIDSMVSLLLQNRACIFLAECPSIEGSRNMDGLAEAASVLGRRLVKVQYGGRAFISQQDWETELNSLKHIFYVGQRNNYLATAQTGETNFKKSPFFQHLCLRFASRFSVLAWNTSANCTSLESFQPDLQRLLGQRFGTLCAGKERKTIALVFGTVGISRQLEIHKRLKLICRVITLVVGKINVPKLENFPEVDAFCLIGCPESSFIPNFRDFSKPLLTPFELEVALGAREWTTEYVLEFEELLKTEPFMSSKADEEEEEISDQEESKAIIGEGDFQLSAFLHQHLKPLHERTFQGVPISLSEAEPIQSDLKIQEGLCGIASGYIQEPKIENDTNSRPEHNLQSIRYSEKHNMINPVEKK